MAWSLATTSDILTLTGSYQTVQRSGADMVITLNPGETANIMLEFSPQAPPTENCDVAILTSGDGTKFDVPSEVTRHILSFQDRDGNTLTSVVRNVEVAGVQMIKIQARVRDTDDTIGGTDTSSTLVASYTTDGVSI